MKSQIRKDNELRREHFCRSLYSAAELRDDPSRDPFFCDLGTLGCTEAHGEWEESWLVANRVRSREEAAERRREAPQRLVQTFRGVLPVLAFPSFCVALIALVIIGGVWSTGGAQKQMHTEQRAACERINKNVSIQREMIVSTEQSIGEDIPEPPTVDCDKL